MNVQYLKCDVEGCGHRETIAALTPEHVGKPCPRCGASLCTQEDYDKFVTISNALAQFFTACPPLDPATIEPGTPLVGMHVHMEDGEVVVEISEATA